MRPTATRSMSNVPSSRNRSDTGHRRRTGPAVLAAILIASAATWIATSAVISTPAEIQDDLAPVPVPPATALVERRAVAVEAVSRGTVQFRNERSIEPPQLPGLENSVPIVTSRRQVGDELVAGDILLEVSYRPIIVLEGTAPLVRDLDADSNGRDVENLQLALAQLGFLDGDQIDGRFGPQTAGAVAALYESIGYAPPKRGGRVVALLAEFWIMDEESVVLRDIAGVGTALVAGTSVATVASPEPVLVTSVSPREAREMSIGNTATILDEVTTHSSEGTITEVGAAPDPETGLVRVNIMAASDLRDDQDYRVTVALAQSDGEVLAVPETALHLGAEGASYVLRQSNGQTERVDVITGISGEDGFVAIEPVDDSALKEGDAVVIGAG